MSDSFTAFEGQRRLASGRLADVALAVKRAERRASKPIAIFSDDTGRPVDLDLRGSADDVLARLAAVSPADAAEQVAPPGEPRGRGRPKLGVVAREVTLLPRHWEWLNRQPGGTSVALRKLVEQARRISGDADHQRAARDAAYHFMAAIAGNLPGFEEASRALFANDRRTFEQQSADWPQDIRAYAIARAFGPVEISRSD